VTSIEEAFAVVARQFQTSAHPHVRDTLCRLIEEQCDRIDWDCVYSWCDQNGTRDLLDELRRSISPI
jgi:hypothetical protein